MNFAQLKDRVIADAWPMGAPENLVDSLSTYILNGLIEVQRSVPCFQYKHDDIHESCKVYWNCGASVVEAPKGEIRRVYTVDTGTDGQYTWCRPVPYRPVDMPEFRRWQAKWKSRWNASWFSAPSGTGANLPMGFDMIAASSDATCGRAQTGVYALDPTTRRLYIAPWIQSTEAIVVEWRGIKRAWASGDTVPEDEDFIRLMRLWVEREFGRKWASTDLPIREGAWREALADMLITCERESRLHGEPVTAEEMQAAEWSAFVSSDPAEDPVPTPEPEANVSLVGDTGTADASAESVADAIIEDNEDGFVILAGDVKYSPNDAATALAPYDHFVSQGRLKAALGNHDLDDGVLGADVRTLVQNPGNGRYFTYRVGPVSFFIVDSGINTAGVRVEPDGNFVGSRQYHDIVASIVRDTNPWKIVVLHHSPYTSSSTYFPGTTIVRWVGDLPVNAVISGHAHLYERLSIGGRTFLTVGTGGATLHDPVGSPYPGSQKRVKSLGFLRLHATCDELTLEFVDTAGVVQDTVELIQPVTIPPQPTPMDPYITVQPTSQAVASSGNATLSVTAIGTAPLTYQWQKDGVAVPGATSSTLAITGVVQSASYRCLVGSAVGYALSDDALIIPIRLSSTSFETLADLLASDATLWSIAEARNYYPGDNNLTLWYVTNSTTILPNGADVLQTPGGVTIVRFFVREAGDGGVVPGGQLAPYTVTVPLVVPTVQDLRDSLFTADMVFIADSQTPFTFVRGELTYGYVPGTDDGIDEVINVAGVHYVRSLRI